MHHLLTDLLILILATLSDELKTYEKIVFDIKGKFVNKKWIDMYLHLYTLLNFISVKKGVYSTKCLSSKISLFYTTTLHIQKA